MPVIYLKFKSHNLIEHLPEELAEFLKEIYDLNLARNEQILLQINDILRLLNTNDIYPTFLKGTGNLLDGLYSDKGERMIGDIDLLVPEADCLRAAQILEQDGYSKHSKKLFSSDSLHYPILFKSGVPAQVEVHRLIVMKQYGKNLNQGLIEKKRVFKFENAICFVLSDRDNAHLNFIHSQLSHDGDLIGIISLRDLYDFYLISKRIDIPSLIPNIQFRRKAISYFVFAGKVFCPPKAYYPTEPISSRILIRKHSLNLNSRTFYKVHQGIMFIKIKIINVYLKLLVQGLFSNEVRRFLFYRLTFTDWYKTHFSRNC